MKKLLLLALLVVGCEESGTESDVYGCTDATACNYNSECMNDDVCCLYPSMLAEDLCNCPSPDMMDAILLDDCGVCRLIDCCETGSDNCPSEEDYNSETDMWIMLNGKYLINNYCRSNGPNYLLQGGEFDWVINDPDWNTTCILP